MARRGTYKFITYHGYEEQDLLFDVAADPLEQNNLAAARPQVRCV